MRSNMSEPIRLGVSAHASVHSEDLRRGVDFAVRRRPSAGDRTVDLVWRDDGGGAESARATAEEFARDAVVAVIGHSRSVAAIAASDVYARHGIVHVSTAASHPWFTDRKLWNVFRLYGRDDDMADTIASFAGSALGCDGLAVLHEATPYGEHLGCLVERAGAEIRLPWISRQPIGAALAGLSAPDRRGTAVFFAGGWEAASDVLSELRGRGFWGPFVASDDGLTPRFIERCGTFASDTYAVAAAPVRVTRQDLQREYERQTGQALDGLALRSFAATEVILQVLGDTASLVGEVIADALRATTRDTVMGPIQFDLKGDIAAAPWTVYAARNGVFVPAWPSRLP